jgi:dUTP pyrophosphatase
MKINIINKSQHALPNYETIASAGMDLQTYRICNIGAFRRTVIKTGLLSNYR